MISIKDKKHIGLFGTRNTGKTFIVGQLLRDEDLLKHMTRDENDRFPSFTQYPLTIHHDKEIKLVEYIDDEIISEFTNIDYIKRYLKLSRCPRALRKYPMKHVYNKHLLLSCPFKDGFQDLVITDTTGTYGVEFETAVMDTYMSYMSKKDTSSIFKITNCIYILKSTYCGSVLNLDDRYMMAKLSKHVKDMEQKMVFAYNMFYTFNNQHTKRDYKMDYVKSIVGANLNTIIDYDYELHILREGANLFKESGKRKERDWFCESQPFKIKL